MTISRSGDIVYITCYFARGASVKSCTVQLKKEEQIFLQNILSSEQCEEMLCYTNGSINVSTLPEDGNLSLFVLDLSSFGNNVYSFDIITPWTISTTDSLFTSNLTTQMETTDQIIACELRLLYNNCKLTRFV